jgi:hypothetical protein
VAVEIQPTLNDLRFGMSGFPDREIHVPETLGWRRRIEQSR